jgi:septum formation protein
VTLAKGFVLASRSRTRIELLTAAGLTFDIDAADIDEDAIGARESEPRARAMLLAVEKARAVSARHSGCFVVGGDQVSVLEDGAYLEKPRDPDDHVRLLMQMSGRTHRFYPSAALVKDDVVIARVSDEVAVTFRKFPEETARAYVASGEGKGSCGGYESEHRGAQLMARIDGSMHAVLGLPLLGVLQMLRDAGVDVPGLLR